MIWSSLQSFFVISFPPFLCNSETATGLYLPKAGGKTTARTEESFLDHVVRATTFMPPLILAGPRLFPSLFNPQHVHPMFLLLLLFLRLKGTHAGLSQILRFCIFSVFHLQASAYDYISVGCISVRSLYRLQLPCRFLLVHLIYYFRDISGLNLFPSNCGHHSTN